MCSQSEGKLYAAGDWDRIEINPDELWIDVDIGNSTPGAPEVRLRLRENNGAEKIDFRSTSTFWEGEKFRVGVRSINVRELTAELCITHR